MWFNLLNIDAPLVAVAWQLWFAQCFGIALAPLSVATLALTVWTIYAADRLLDVRDGHKGRLPATERHSFHRKHAGALRAAVTFSLVLLAFSATRLNGSVLRNGLFLSGVVGLYFAAVHLLPKCVSTLYPKEMVVGIVFATGTALAPCSRLHRVGPFLVPVALFALLCFLNCAAIETWEWGGSGHRKTERPHSVTIWFSRHLKLLSISIAITGVAFLLLSRQHAVFAPIVLSALAFLWLDLEHEHLTISLLRVLADVPLLSPLLLLRLYRG